jgi:hypothetical protein
MLVVVMNRERLAVLSAAAGNRGPIRHAQGLATWARYEPGIGDLAGPYVQLFRRVPAGSAFVPGDQSHHDSRSVTPAAAMSAMVRGIVMLTGPV